MRLDDNGRPQPTGEYEELAGESVILALGQDVERTILETLPGVQIVDGVVQVDASMMTGHPGVFAGGDMIPSTRSVTVGIGHGKAAAANIDRWLRGTSPLPAVEGRVPVAFGSLNPWYYSDAPHAVRPRLDAGRRVADFSEVVGGLDADTALYEARRCMSCGNCFRCDNCFGVCPDNAVLKVDEAHGYAFNYDYCKGCGLCAAECPCGAIKMEPETS
jgi:2-oxoacid:acceptor oxidoreductase delta subunit (pyruvate/2-ketoisovalerate family)